MQKKTRRGFLGLITTTLGAMLGVFAINKAKGYSAASQQVHDELIIAARTTQIENYAHVLANSGFESYLNNGNPKIQKAANDCWAINTLWEHYVSQLPVAPTEQQRLVMNILTEKARVVNHNLGILTGIRDGQNIEQLNNEVQQIVDEIIQGLP
jgi:hypothetical protein